MLLEAERQLAVYGGIGCLLFALGEAVKYLENNRKEET